MNRPDVYLHATLAVVLAISGKADTSSKQLF